LCTGAIAGPSGNFDVKALDKNINAELDGLGVG